MKTKVITATVLVIIAIAIAQITTSEYYYHPEFSKNSYGTVHAYPPAVGVFGNAKNCLACHVNDGPWKDEGKTIIDMLDKSTKKSLRQPDGSFLIEVKRNEVAQILTVIGRTANDTEEAPHRNAFLFIDPTTIGTSSLSKFAPGWNVNLPLGCKLVGDNLAGYEKAKITKHPMSVMPTDDARDAELVLQVMLTDGKTIKGDAEGGKANYFERIVKLKVID